MNKIDSNEAAQALRGLKMRYAGHALSHIQEVDLESASYLGLAKFTRLPEEEAMSVDDLLPIVLDETHANRVSIPEGPLICYFEGEDESRRVVLHLDQMLFSQNHRMRSAVLAHFERLSNVGGAISPGVLNVLNDATEPLGSQLTGQWQPAAAALARALRSDFLISVSGIRQSTALKYDDGLEVFTRRALNPSEYGVDLASIEHTQATGKAAEIELTIDRLIAATSDLKEFCDSYMSHLGHMQLAPPSSLGAALSRWELHNEKNKFESQEIVNWAMNHGSPIARYHAADAVLNNWESASGIEAPKFHDLIVELLQSRTNLREDSTSKLSLRCTLARHYQNHLLNIFPGLQHEVTSSIAWWLSEKLASALGDNLVFLGHYETNAIHPALQDSQLLREISAPRCEPSSAFYSTAYFDSPFRYSLLCSLASSTHLFDELLDSLDIFASALFEGLAYPVSDQHDHIAPQPLASNRNLHSIVTERLDSVKNEEIRELVKTTKALQPLVGQDADMCEAISELENYDPTTQLFVAVNFRSRAYYHKLAVDKLWPVISNPDWASNFLVSAPEYVVAIVCEALANIQNDCAIEDWRFDLPHVLASACELSDDESRTSLLFSFTVRTTFISGSNTALRRLVSGPNYPKFSLLVAALRQNLVTLESDAEPWIASRIRGVLSSLSPV